jgi:hypothetical protein
MKFPHKHALPSLSTHRRSCLPHPWARREMLRRMQRSASLTPRGDHQDLLQMPTWELIPAGAREEFRGRLTPMEPSNFAAFARCCLKRTHAGIGGMRTARMCGSFTPHGTLVLSCVKTPAEALARRFLQVTTAGIGVSIQRCLSLLRTHRDSQPGFSQANRHLSWRLSSLLQQNWLRPSMSCPSISAVCRIGSTATPRLAGRTS